MRNFIQYIRSCLPCICGAAEVIEDVVLTQAGVNADLRNDIHRAAETLL